MGTLPRLHLLTKHCQLKSAVWANGLDAGRAVEITYNVILDQVQAIYFDLRSDQEQITFVIFLPYEKIKIS